MSISSRVYRRFFGTTSFQRALSFSSFDESIGAYTITLNDPARRNALSNALLDELNEAMNSVPSDARIVVLKSTGTVFSSGHNLKETGTCEIKPSQGALCCVIAMTDEEQKEMFMKSTELMMAIHNCPVPTMAVVNGLATAAGFQLALACDLLIASQKAGFATPGASIGLFCSTPGVELIRNTSSKIALKLLYTGDVMDAEVALRSGIVSEVVDEHELDAYVDELVRKICSKSSSAKKLGKRVFQEQSNLPLREAYDVARAGMFDNLKLNDAKEGIQAFVEKRQANWTHS